jgi:hypothetical protein
MIVRFLFWLGIGWRGKAFAAACAVLGVLCVVSAAIPYEPYRPVGFAADPTAVCADDEVGLVATRVWHETWYQSVGTMHLVAQWRDIDTGAYYPAFNGPIRPKLDEPRGTIKSDVRMPVPTAKGEYRLFLQYDIEGGVLVMPRHQDVPADEAEWLTSDNTLTIKDCQ